MKAPHTAIAVVAVGLCCALPAIIASGAIATVGGIALRAWPIALPGLGLLLYGGLRSHRRVRAMGTPPLDQRRRQT